MLVSELVGRAAVECADVCYGVSVDLVSIRRHVAELHVVDLNGDICLAIVYSCRTNYTCSADKRTELAEGR